MDWLVLQLADTAFPTGGFAHSAGLEATAQLGELRGAGAVERFVQETIWQAALGAVPFVRGGHAAAATRGVGAIAKVDRACDAFLTAKVTNRASRTQGRAFVGTAARVFDVALLRSLHDEVKGRRIAAHHAPLFGAALGALDVPEADAARLFLHLTLRGVASAAVRLGLLGPHESHALQHAQRATLDRALAATRGLGPEDAVQPSPLLEMFGNHQDGLYSRLFAS